MLVYKVGDRVQILRTDIKALEHRKYPVSGVITRIDGECILVRPSHCRWEIELYRSEISK